MPNLLRCMWAVFAKCQLDDLTAVDLVMKRLTLRIILHEGKKNTHKHEKKKLSEAVF